MGGHIRSIALFFVLALLPLGSRAEDELPMQPQQGIIGWEGDADAVIVYPNGSFFVRDQKRKLIRFSGIEEPTSLRWYNEAGYLPCLVSEFDSGGLHYRISHFADRVTIDDDDRVVAYSRIDVTGFRDSDQEDGFDPGAPTDLTPLGPPEHLPSGGLRVDYAIESDRFGKNIYGATSAELLDAGGYDEHFAHMRSYWDSRLAEVARLETPDEKLNNAYKAGFIYTQIVRDGDDLKPGETGYDDVYDHDAQGIAAFLFQIGDFREAPRLIEALPMKLTYDDANWRYSWPLAVYLQKSGDSALIASYWDRLKQAVATIHGDRTGPQGILKTTEDIDAEGYWLVDDTSALQGLAAFRFIAERLGHPSEADWAAREYASVSDSLSQVLSTTMRNFGLGYLPISMVEPNDANRARLANDANWASSTAGLEELWLLNAKIPDLELVNLQKTYDYGMDRLAKIGMPTHTFGGFPGYTNGYNAMYAEGGLLTEKYRDEPIHAYEFLLEHALSGPLSFYEHIDDPAPSAWEGTHPSTGNGDCPHIWGQSVDMKAVLDSIVAERFDGSLVIGRGVPREWLATPGHSIALSNFPASGRRIDVRISRLDGEVYELRLGGAIPDVSITLDLPSIGHAIAVPPGQRILRVTPKP